MMVLCDDMIVCFVIFSGIQLDQSDQLYQGYHEFLKDIMVFSHTHHEASSIINYPLQ